MSEDKLLKCKSDMDILTIYMQKPIARVFFFLSQIVKLPMVEESMTIVVMLNISAILIKLCNEVMYMFVWLYKHKLNN